MKFKCTEVRCNTFLPIEYCIITDNKLPYCTGGEGVNLYLVYNWYAITLELTSEFLSSFIIPSSFFFIFFHLPRDRLVQECDHHDVQEVNTTFPFI